MAPMTRDQVIAALVDHGAAVDDASMYADAFQEYQRATANIQEHGVIISHPRTGNPVDNPYLRIRDRALKKLRAMREIDAAFLWS